MLEMDDSDSDDELLRPRSSFAPFEQYKNEPHIDLSECPLEWWRKHEGAYANLAKLARKFLASPATTVPCERLFSLSGNIVTKKRASLSADNINKLVSLSSWLRNDDNMNDFE